jgi:hypothetical protein
MDEENEGKTTGNNGRLLRLSLANTLVFSIASFSIRRIVLETIPLFGVSILIAESFFKFRSFTLELLAFLATWFILDLLLQLILTTIRRSDRNKGNMRE